MRETRVQSLSREDPLEKEVATHSSSLAWRIPWREEPGRLQSMGSQRVGHDWATSLSLSHTGELINRLGTITLHLNYMQLLAFITNVSSTGSEPRVRIYTRGGTRWHRERDYSSPNHWWLSDVKVKSLSHIRLLATPWTAAYQVSPSIGFSRHEYWSGVPLPSPTSILALNKLKWIDNRWWWS